MSGEYFNNYSNPEWNWDPRNPQLVMQSRNSPFAAREAIVSYTSDIEHFSGIDQFPAASHMHGSASGQHAPVNHQSIVSHPSLFQLFSSNPSSSARIDSEFISVHQRPFIASNGSSEGFPMQQAHLSTQNNYSHLQLLSQPSERMAHDPAGKIG